MNHMKMFIFRTPVHYHAVSVGEGYIFHGGGHVFHLNCSVIILHHKKSGYGSFKEWGCGEIPAGMRGKTQLILIGIVVL